MREGSRSKEKSHFISLSLSFLLWGKSGSEYHTSHWALGRVNAMIHVKGLAQHLAQLKGHTLKNGTRGLPWWRSG